MSQQPLDLLVVGGGITGAGIALDAAVRGMKVGLVEKQDFAAGTSSRSTKLIHGGLRYLKQGEVRLVREVGRERAILYRNAPHVVVPEKMLLPIVKGGTYGWLATSLGLWVYDRLAGVAKPERRIMLSKAQAERVEPLLRRDILRGAGLYTEYRTDDARLTVEVAKTAASRGAWCVNYAGVTDFLYDGGRLAGARVRDNLTGEVFEIRARVVVNAAGPWVDAVRSLDGPVRGKRLHLTKGVHIVVRRSRLPLAHSVYFDVPDGRMVFAIPRGECTYIGTTDTDYQGPLESPEATEEDVRYLLNAANHMFPEPRLTEHDIIASWAGMRPLIHEDGKSPSELSRRDEIMLSDTGLVTIAGGKLTGYRKMAERVVNLVAARLEAAGDRQFPPCTTDRIALSGGAFHNPDEVPQLADELAERALALGLDPVQASALVWRYGVHARGILERAADEALTAPPEWALLRAELRYGVECEMVCTLSDFFVRRTSRLWFEPEVVARTREPVLAALAEWLSWGPEEVEEHRRRFAAECAQSWGFPRGELAPATSCG
ncbi:MAG: glycerol-3-phosphate dehydrogenase/oxidase [Alicyclobacillus sp.]|nr:glycerol-3-phosphate dehydrogenase/oxidase [Alicyclobacillus sp.]